MHGVMGKLPPTATKNVAASKLTLLLLVAMTGVAPISLYMLVPALPKLATAFGRDELDWLNAYHTRVLAEVGPALDEPTRAWLEQATAKLT